MLAVVNEVISDDKIKTVDESTHKTHTAQLCIYVRYFYGKCFREELLSLLPLKGHTTSEVLFESGPTEFLVSKIWPN